MALLFFVSFVYRLPTPRLIEVFIPFIYFIFYMKQVPPLSVFSQEKNFAYWMPLFNPPHPPSRRPELHCTMLHHSSYNLVVSPLTEVAGITPFLKGRNMFPLVKLYLR